MNFGNALDKQFEILTTIIRQVGNRGDAELQQQAELALVEIDRHVAKQRAIADEANTIRIIVSGLRPCVGEPTDTGMGLSAIQDLLIAVKSAKPSSYASSLAWK